MLTVTDAQKQHEAMESERRRDEPAWEDLAALLRPDDNDFQNSGNKDRGDDSNFDSTPLYALDTFQGGMFGQATNPATRWFELTLEDEDRARFRPNKEWLYRTTNLIYASLSPAVSTFYSEVPAWFANVGAFGNGALFQEEIEGERFIADRAAPLHETYWMRDARGNLSKLNRVCRWKGWQIKKEWPRHVAANCQDDNEYKVIQAIAPNEHMRPGRLGPEGMPLSSLYFSPDLKHFEVAGGFYEMPGHVIGWNHRSGRSYATGPGHNALGDMITNNETERSYLVAEQFTAEPPILTRDESKFTAADIEPNAVLEGAWENGKPNMGILERRQKLEYAQQRAAQRREAILRAFHFATMQVALGRPQMTAGEFFGWQEESLKIMAPNLLRVQTGGLSPFIARRFRILDRAGQIAAIVGPPPPDLRGRIEIEYVSPLAKVMKSAKARGVLQYVDALSKVSVATADPEVMDNVDGDHVSIVLHEAYTDDPKVQRDPREVAERRQARAQQRQQMAQIEKTGRVVEIAAEASHAAQASSLSAQRGRSQ